MLLELLRKKEYNIKNELLSGITVALALVPEAIAFAFVAGVEPLVGLYAAFIVGLLTSLFGGRPGMISGATGGLAVVMLELVSKHGVEYLFATVVLMGIIEIIVGVLRLGKFVRIIPHSVMLGFVNGLAIVIFLAQLSQFKTQGSNGEMVWLTGGAMVTMLLLVAVTMAIIYLLPKITKAVPSALVAIIFVAVIVNVFKIDTKTVGDVASVSGGFPKFHIPNIPFDFNTLKIILPYAVVYAGVALIESLMTLTLVDEMTDTRGSGNRECIGQGIANIVTGFFGGMGGCAMIGQSMINIRSGGKKRLSGASAAIFLLGFIMFGAGLIDRIPLAALVGVMFSVVIATFEWSSIRAMKNIPIMDAFIIVLVSAVTVYKDLAIAVVVGVIVSALSFAWRKGKKIEVAVHSTDKEHKIYKVRGLVFFASIHNFIETFTPKEDPRDVIIDFSGARVIDYSAVEAINRITVKYRELGKVIHLRSLSKDCYGVIKNAEEIIDVNILEDPTYFITINKQKKRLQEI